MEVKVGRKFDQGKAQADLLLGFARALEAIADLLTFGAEKYTRDGWTAVPNAEQRYKAALMRHLLQSGYEDIDSDSSRPHDVAVAWNALATLELRLRREANDAEVKSEEI